MEKIIKRIYIKDLLILQSPIVYKMIEPYMNSARQKGVYIEELAMNLYIYEYKSLDIPYLVNYFKALNNLANLFRDIYDYELYILRIQNHIDDSIYNENSFQMIFNAMNNDFNLYLDDRYLFEDFSIYQSETSLFVIQSLFDTFNNQFSLFLEPFVNRGIIQMMTAKRIKNFINYFYDKIYEQFECIYLPFY